MTKKNSINKETLEQFSVLLLDMNHTFMFEFDRFSETENFHKSYCELGGNSSTREQVNLAIRTCHTYMLKLYESPTHYEKFPTVEETLRMLDSSAEFDDQEINLLVNTFAMHEMGVIPQSYLECLQVLSNSFRLGLISNLWAPKTKWEQVFERTGLHLAFEVTIFSSDFNFIKPSPLIFDAAIEELNGIAPIEKQEVLMIGDSQRCDVGGAINAGIQSAWVSNQREIDSSAPNPDFVLKDLLELGQVATVSV